MLGARCEAGDGEEVRVRGGHVCEKGARLVKQGGDFSCWDLQPRKDPLKVDNMLSSRGMLII